MRTAVDLFSGAAESQCAACGSSFAQYRSTHLYCSKRCATAARVRRLHGHPIARKCKSCGIDFLAVGAGMSNRQHCSVVCARESARRSRKAFRERNPQYSRRYYGRPRAPRGAVRTLERLWRKYPGLPRECEACAEDRVLDVAHRPEHARRGAWRTMQVMEPHMIWVLCPTCHALLDRAGYTAEQLGIAERRR